MDDEQAYDTCHSCGKSVFHGVTTCPYCHNDPYGQYDECTHCGKSLPPDVARCPYCGSYTDGQGPGGERARRPIPRIYLIAGWLVILGFLLPLIIALIQWLT
jgi:RNA polymerase subunit RPABC4/transcription elongation factor Spt4